MSSAGVPFEARRRKMARSLLIAFAAGAAFALGVPLSAQPPGGGGAGDEPRLRVEAEAYRAVGLEGLPPGEDATAPEAQWSAMVAAGQAVLSSLEEISAELGVDGAEVRTGFSLIPAGDEFETEPSRVAAERVLREAQSRGAFAPLDRFVEWRRALRPPQEGPLHDWLLPELRMMRDLARLNGARMYLAARAGDADTFDRALRSLLVTAQVLMQQPTKLDALTGVAIATLATDRIVNLVPVVDDPVLERAASALSTFPPPTMVAGIRGERLIARDGARWVREGANPAGSLERLMMLWSLQGEDDRPTTGPIVSLEDELRVIDLYFNAAATQAAMPAFERRAVVRNLDEARAAIPAGAMVARLHAGPDERALLSADFAQARLAAAVLMIAVERYRAARGAAPADAADLVPEFLPQLPIDPFSGAPLVYRRQPDGPYIIYSAGVDGVDDGGAFGDEGVRTMQGPGPGIDLRLVPPAVD